MSDNERKTWIMLKKADNSVEFNENILPTFTAEGKDGVNCEATNDWGTWRVYAVSRYSDTRYYHPFQAVDGNLSSYFRSGTIGGTGSYSYWYIDCPDGVSIQPASISLKYSYCETGSALEAYNPITRTWEQLIEIPRSNESAKTLTYSNTESKTYYSRFRVKQTRWSSASVYCYVWEFKILAGRIQKGVTPQRDTFDNCIIPQFELTTIDGQERMIGNNKYGTWEIIINETQNSILENINNMFDDDENTSATFTHKGNYTDAYGNIELILPEKMTISPRAIEVVLTGQYSTTLYLQGFNTDTNSWTTISSTLKGGDNYDKPIYTVQNFTILDPGYGWFFNKFRLCFSDTTFTSAAKERVVNNFKMTAGLIKIDK